MKIAVCVSGITSRIPEYKKVVELQRRVFGEYDFSFNNGRVTQSPTYLIAFTVPNRNGTIIAFWKQNTNPTVKYTEDIPGLVER